MRWPFTGKGIPTGGTVRRPFTGEGIPTGGCMRRLCHQSTGQDQTQLLSACLPRSISRAPPSRLLVLAHM